MSAHTPITIFEATPAEYPDFKRLNLAWIEEYFRVEPHDIEQLNDPEHHILASGGRILVAQYQGTIVGTVALVQVSPIQFELAKMAVDPAFQGLQIGKKLGEACIELARQLGGKEIFLESNTKLVPAITLYRRLGFEEIPITGTPYERADIRMMLELR
jgi:GNAT superfamily N-acetyltransferase